MNSYEGGCNNLALFENKLWIPLKPDVFSFCAEQKLLPKGSCSVVLISEN